VGGKILNRGYEFRKKCGRKRTENKIENIFYNYINLCINFNIA